MPFAYFCVFCLILFHADSLFLMHRSFRFVYLENEDDGRLLIVERQGDGEGLEEYWEEQGDSGVPTENVSKHTPSETDDITLCDGTQVEK